MYPVYGGACQSGSSVIINEIMFRPYSGRPEWVELYNRGKFPVDIGGWAICDSDTSRRSFVPHTPTVIPSGGFVVLAQFDISPEIMDTHVPCIVLERFPRLNNDGDSVVLFNQSNRIQERLEYDSWWSGSQGVSLERISPIDPIGEFDNWGASVATFGSTPGARNSLFADHSPKEIELRVTPNPFSPDGDDFEDFADFTYSLPMTKARVSIFVYDIKGRLVRSLKSAAFSGSTGRFIWEGLSNSGKPATPGLYIIYIEGLCQTTGRYASAKRSIALTRKD